MHTAGTPPHDVDGLCVLYEGGQIRDLAFVAVGVDFPQLRQSARARRGCSSPTRTRTLLSPPAVANRPLPWGSKCAE